MIGDDSTISLASAPPPIDRSLVAGRVIGRYELVAELGAGGMGIVWEARDRELDRGVALKVVRSVVSEDAKRRLHREARAMAKLSHPAVVPVFDIGTFADQIYVVMELVAGRTLAQVLREDALPWRRIVELFIACGRGLAAAHAAGIVHRDFKPSNVLIAASGDVKVTDFGLAQLGDAPDPVAVGSQDDTPSSIGGTPRYMPPEQLAGRATVQSDQYAFCVALDEAVADAPAALAATIQRGLAEDPGARWPSMTALLDALARVLARRRRRLMVAGAGVAAFAIAAAIVLTRSEPPDPCGGFEDQLGGAWNPTTRAAIERALGGEIATRTVALLDQRVRDWTDARIAVCKAAARSELPAELAGARVACLERKRDELVALARLLGSAGEQVRAQAIGAADRARVADCQDARVVGDDARGLAVAAARVQVAEAKARANLTLPDADKFLRAGAEIATALGARSVAADALLALAGMPGIDDATARDALERAIRYAGELHDDVLFARALIDQLHHVGSSERHTDEALAMRPHALAALASAGSPPWLEVKYHYHVGKVLMHADRLDEARDELERAVALAEHGAIESGPNPDNNKLAELHYAVGQIAEQRGDLEAAQQAFQRSLALVEQHEGTSSSISAFPLHGLAEVTAELGKQHEALVLRRRVFALFSANMPATSTLVGSTAAALASSLAKAGREPEARALFERASKILETGYGPNHARVGELASRYGEAELDLGHVREGLARLARGVEIQRMADKPGLDLEDALARLALAEAVAGDARAGLEHAREALAIVEHTRRSPADPLIALGASEVALGNVKEAIADLEHALALRGNSPPQRARAAVFLARALWSSDRVRANSLARDAAVVFEDDRYWRAIMERWLASVSHAAHSRR